jgi:hypothetical protein
MRNLFIAILILNLSIPVFAQDYQRPGNFPNVAEPTYIVYVSKNLIGTGRTDIAIGAPLYNDNFYYAMYFSKMPGLRLEYKFANCWVTGFSLMDDKSHYFFRYHFGMKLNKHFMISESFRDGEGGFEIVYFF